MLVLAGTQTLPSWRTCTSWLGAWMTCCVLAWQAQKPQVRVVDHRLGMSMQIVQELPNNDAQRGNGDAYDGVPVIVECTM